jgi:hypothetical protein
MNKFKASALFALIALSLAACGGGSSTTTSSVTEPAAIRAA